MIALLVLIFCFMLAVLTGKYARKINYLGYLLIAVITALEVAFVVYYMFTMEVPTP